MEPKFQSSFIPKSSTQETMVPREVETATGPREGTGLWSFFSNIIFTLAIVASLAVFGGKWYMNRTITSMNESLAAAKEEIQPDRINEISRSYDRIISAKEVLNNHVYVSRLMEEIQAITVKNLRLTDLSVDLINGKDPVIAAKGESLGYLFIAQQADLFNKQNFLKDVNFFDMSLNETGAVRFSMRAIILPSIFTNLPVEQNSEEIITQ